MHNVTLIPGDGIGPEVTYATKEVIDATGVKINWEIVEAGIKTMETMNTPLPEQVLESIRKNKVALKGPVTTPIGEGFRSVNVTLRKELELYANLRPIKSLPGIKSKFEDIDLVVVRENTEDLYTGIEHKIGDYAGESIKLITREASERIGRFAFNYAQNMGRKKVTAVHKANILKISDGLFLECVRQVASEFPEIEYEEIIIDNCCMQLVMKPEQFDVMVLPNLYGDIVSDLGAGLIGGLGLTYSGNIGKNFAVFEAVHGSAPDIAGKDIANPLALLQSGIMMLKHLHEYNKATVIEDGILSLLNQKDELTPDLGGKGTTSSVTKYLCNFIKEALE